jgi:ATP-dependent HslUV protease ATP-binding subunit HslU
MSSPGRCIYTNETVIYEELADGNLSPVQAAEDTPLLDELTPREIVRGQICHGRPMPSAPSPSRCATASVARSSFEMADEVMPKNILMIGPTAPGKPSERAGWQAREFAPSQSKVSKFTEVAMSAATSNP